MTWRSSLGFSLLELLVVLGIAAATLTLVVPRFVQTLEKAQFEAAVLEVVSGLRQARGIALLQQREATFWINVEEKHYRVDHYRKRLPSEALALRIETAEQDLTPSGGRIRFFPDGSSTGWRITMVWGKRQREIDVNWLTGRVVVVRMPE